jgi:hypothetical protein
MRKLIFVALTGLSAAGCAAHQPVPVILSEGGAPVAALAKPGMSCTQSDGSPLSLGHLPEDVALTDGSELHMRVQGGRAIGYFQLPSSDQLPGGVKCLTNMSVDRANRDFFE